MFSCLLKVIAKKEPPLSFAKAEHLRLRECIKQVARLQGLNIEAFDKNWVCFFELITANRRFPEKILDILSKSLETYRTFEAKVQAFESTESPDDFFADLFGLDEFLEMDQNQLVEAAQTREAMIAMCFIFGVCDEVTRMDLDILFKSWLELSQNPPKELKLQAKSVSFIKITDAKGHVKGDFDGLYTFFSTSFLDKKKSKWVAFKSLFSPYLICADLSHNYAHKFQFVNIIFPFHDGKLRVCTPSFFQHLCRSIFSDYNPLTLKPGRIGFDREKKYHLEESRHVGTTFSFLAQNPPAPHDMYSHVVLAYLHELFHDKTIASHASSGMEAYSACDKVLMAVREHLWEGKMEKVPMRYKPYFEKIADVQVGFPRWTLDDFFQELFCNIDTNFDEMTKEILTKEGMPDFLGEMLEKYKPRG